MAAKFHPLVKDAVELDIICQTARAQALTSLYQAVALSARRSNSDCQVYDICKAHVPNVQKPESEAHFGQKFRVSYEAKKQKHKE